jgi:hypothetical protein
MRKELQVLQRSVKRPRLNLWDRLFFVSLVRLGHGNGMKYCPHYIPITCIQAWLGS